MTTTPLSSRTPAADWPGLALARAEQAGEPAWAIARRRRAAGIAAALPLPDRSLELWRRTDFGSLQLDALEAFTTPAPARNVDDLPAAVIARLAGETAPVGVIALRNGVAVLEQTHPDLARRGVILCSMERALREHAALLEAHLDSLVETDHDHYTALQQAVRTGGAFVWIPDGVELETPIRLFHWLDGAGAFAAPSTVIVAGRRARATVFEEYLSETADGIAFHDGQTEVFVAEEAKLIYANLQEWGRNVFHYSNQRARVQRDGELQWIHTFLGSRMTKTNSYWTMADQAANVFVHGFMFGDQRQHFDLHTLQKHHAPHCTSDLLIKGCLKDKARSVYQGLIQVAEGAQRTDAYQANRNLVLSGEARADSIPGLEILANDVRCTHGATIGNVDREQMYYLMARGLPENEAQRLIVEGFFAPVLDRIPLEGVRDQLREAIRHKIG